MQGWKKNCWNSLVSHLFKDSFAFGILLSVSYLRLQVLYLLLDEVVALLFIQVVACFLADILFQFLKFQLAIRHLHQSEETFFDVRLSQQVQPVDEIERHVGAEVVDSHHVVFNVVYCIYGLVWNVFVYVNVPIGTFTKVFHCRHKLLVAYMVEYLWCRSDICHKVGRSRVYVAYRQTAEGLEYCTDVSSRQLKNLYHPCIYSQVEHFVSGRDFDFRIKLRYDSNKAFVLFVFANKG